MATGRIVNKWVNLVIGDIGAVLRDIPLNELGICGIAYDEVNTTAWADAVSGALPGMPDAPIEWGGPWSTAAAQTASGTGVAPALSGSHTILFPLNGRMTPLTLDIQFGIRATWATNDPQFGISTAAGVGYIITKYDVNLDDMTYSARAVLYPGSTLPAWGTSAEA